MSTSGWDIKMLFMISLASLDGPLAEFEFGGGERSGIVVEGFVLLDPCGSWAAWFARRLRELCVAPCSTATASILPFASRLELGWPRREESV